MSSKLNYYDKIVPLFKTGKLTPDSVIAQGTAPHTVGYVEAPGDKTFANGETGWFTMVPTIYNADTLGIRPDLVGREITTWADIMDPAFKGKTSILNIPSIGIMDAAMIMEAMGNIKYADKGNMTKEEIDTTIDFLIKAKQDGQFRAFWKSFDESVNLMARAKWSSSRCGRRPSPPCAPRASPASTSRSRKAIARGAAASASPRICQGAQLDAAYEYINWYTSGWVGGYLNRQGYYSAAMDTAKEFMSDDEWGYWIEGKPAEGDILAPDGKVMEKAGAVRDGGSFDERMGKVACWNSVMDEDRYMVTPLERVHRGVTAPAAWRMHRPPSPARGRGWRDCEARDSATSPASGRGQPEAAEDRPWPSPTSAAIADAKAEAAARPLRRAPSPLSAGDCRCWLILGFFLLLPILLLAGRQLLGLRLRRDVSRLPDHQLRRDARLLGHLEDLSQHAEIRRHRLGASRSSSASGSPISSPSTSARAAMQMVLFLSAPCRSSPPTSSA